MKMNWIDLTHIMCVCVRYVFMYVADGKAASIQFMYKKMKKYTLYHPTGMCRRAVSLYIAFRCHILGFFSRVTKKNDRIKAQDI